MKEFLKGLYTSSDGYEYMTFFECSMNDSFLVAVTILLSLGVLTTYLLVAFDAFNKGRYYEDSATKKYLNSLMKVFLLCALTGYGYTILSTWINPYWLRVYLLLILLHQSIMFYVRQKNNTSIEKVYKKEQELAEKYKSALVEQEKIVDLFDNKKNRGNVEVAHMLFDEHLAPIKHNVPFDSDGSGVIENTRINERQPGFTATSVMKPNSYIPPHSHDTDKILTVLEGSFYDGYTKKLYSKGEYLYLPAAVGKNKDIWHDLKSGNEKTELLTFIMPRK